MSLPIHTVIQGAGSTAFAQKDRMSVVALGAVAYGAGGSAGASVTVAVTGLSLPATYCVLPGDPGQDATVFVSGRTQSGFTLHLSPRLASATLAAGAVDIVVIH
jgi:hypothetical protein